MKTCLFVVLLLCAGCSTYERVEQHHYYGSTPSAILLEPQPARLAVEIRR